MYMQGILIISGTRQRNGDKYEWTKEQLDDSTSIKWQFQNNKPAWKHQGNLHPYTCEVSENEPDQTNKPIWNG